MTTNLRYNTVFDLDRLSQVRYIRASMLYIEQITEGGVDDEALERAIWDLDCDLHTILDRIMLDARERNRLLALTRKVSSPVTLDDLA